MDSKIELNVEGPFCWVCNNTIFNAPESDLSGLYIFSIETHNGYLIEYVGITTRSFFERLCEHTREFLSGGYKIYEYEKFIKGVRASLWNGRFGKNKEKDVTKFLTRYGTLTSALLKQLGAYRVFVIPITDGRIAERLEGEMYQILKTSKLKQVREFIDNEVQYKVRESNEKPIKVKINSQDTLLGLSSEFSI